MNITSAMNQKLNEALLPLAQGVRTRRDATLPNVPNKIHAVIGMRRAGKTTYLRQLQAALRATLPPEQALYLSFDDERVADADALQLGALVEEHYRRYPELRGKRTVHWFLDEIQLVPGWERFVRRLVDTENVTVVVSGSSSKMLSREVHTSLRGRGMETVIAPFGFREFLRHRGAEPSTDPRTWSLAQRSKIEKHFADYLVVGGFPEVQGLAAPLRMELLQGYVDTVLFRDVVERYGLTQVSALRWVVRHCLRNPAGSFSVHRLFTDLRAQGHNIGKEAVTAMIAHLEDAFLIAAVPIATDSERQKNSNPRKVYPADPGLIHAFDVSARANTGHALETAVYNELSRRRASVAYVKTAEGYEVDFLAHHAGKQRELIQVCTDMGEAETDEREWRALQQARKVYPRVPALVLTQNHDAMEQQANKGTRIAAAYEWMLSEAQSV